MAENDRETLEDLIREELEHSEVMKRLEAFEKRTGEVTFWEVAKHPFVITLLGFLMTGLIGTYIESRFSQSRENQAQMFAVIDQARAAEVEAQQAFLALGAPTRRRITAGSMLRSAIVRASKLELTGRKASYDANYVEWNNKIWPELIGLRQHLIAPESAPIELDSPFEPAVGDVVRPLLSEIDACLTEAFDASNKSLGRLEDFDRTTNGGEVRVSDFFCAGQPNPTCTGLVEIDVQPKNDEQVETDVPPGTDVQTDNDNETGADGEETCKEGYWWHFVRTREKQVRECSAALIKDAFLYLRARTNHEIAIARGEKSEAPEASIRVFTKDCGAVLDNEFELWNMFLNKQRFARRDARR